MLTELFDLTSQGVSLLVDLVQGLLNSLFRLLSQLLGLLERVNFGLKLLGFLFQGADGLTYFILFLLFLENNLVKSSDLLEEGPRISYELHLLNDFLFLLAISRGHLKLSLELLNTLFKHVELVVSLMYLLFSLDFAILSIRDLLVKVFNDGIDTFALITVYLHGLKELFELLAGTGWQSTLGLSLNWVAVWSRQTLELQ